MMNNIFSKTHISQLVVSLGICMLLLACKTKQMENNSLQKENSFLANCWTHSYEEQTQDELKIYRPCAYKTFPPSRYRNTFTLNADNTCQASVLSPTDAHYNQGGNWTFNENTKILEINNGQVKIYKVIELTKDKLTVKVQ